MATLYVSEHSGMGNGAAQAVGTPELADNNVPIGGASVQSQPFNKDTSVIRVHTDAICSVAFGANPVATTANMRLAANQTEYFLVNPGSKIAVIANV